LQVTSNGHTITLAGVYGDALQTLVFLRLDVVGRPWDFTLTEGSVVLPGGSVAGEGRIVALAYPPLTAGQHALTLRVTSIVLRPLPGQAAAAPIQGDWTLAFPLRASPQLVKVSQRDGQLGNVQVHVEDVAGDGYVLAVSLETTGATIDELSGLRSEEGVRGAPAPAPTPAPGSFQVELLDANGKQLPLIGQTAEVAGKESAEISEVSWQAYWSGTGPGTYQLVMGYRDQRFVSTFTVR
jgi:hypothetical protein